MNLWPFKSLPSFENICPKCGQHMIKPKQGEPYCVYAMCEDGAENHAAFVRPDNSI